MNWTCPEDSSWTWDKTFVSKNKFSVFLSKAYLDSNASKVICSKLNIEMREYVTMQI